MSDYTLSNEWAHAQQRLKGLADWFDPGTRRCLEDRGLARGWRCLEVGAGFGSIASWLAERVGPSGSVLATDIDTRFLRPSGHLSVLEHDIMRAPLPQGDFDLIHARFVLEHLAAPEQAIRHMSAALRPGGVLVIEDTDYSSWLPAPQVTEEGRQIFAKWSAALREVLTEAGGDMGAGRRRLADLIGAGFTQVDAEGRVYMVRGASLGAEVWRLTAEQLRERALATGRITAAELTRYLELLTQPSFIWMEGMVMATWGIRPAS